VRTVELTDDTITVPVDNPEMFSHLADTIVKDPDNVITHVITVGPFFLAGSWVVTRTHQNTLGRREITLTRVVVY